MNIKLENDIYILSINKIVNAGNIQEFKEKIQELKTNKAKKIIIDFNSIDFIISEAMGQLVSLLKYIREYKGKIVICNLNSKVRRLFNITRLDLVFNIVESLNDAKEKFRNDSQAL